MSIDIDLAMTMNRKQRRVLGKLNGKKIRGTTQPFIKPKTK